MLSVRAEGGGTSAPHVRIRLTQSSPVNTNFHVSVEDANT